MHVYENKKIILLLSFGLLLIELLTIYCFIKAKTFCYKKYTGVVVNNDEIVLLVSKEDKGFILKRDNIKYDEIIIKMKMKKEKINDTVTFSVKTHKDSWIKLLNIIEEGDWNNKIRQW